MRSATAERLSARRNRRTQKRSGDHAGGIRAILTGYVQRGAVIGRGARERKPQRDIYRAAERRDFDSRHPDVVIWRDHGVEFAAHRSHKNRIRGKRALDSGGARGRREKFRVLAAESSAVTRVRIESAQRNSRRCDSEPPFQPVARDARGFDDGSCAQILSHAAQSDVGGREHDAKLVRCEHHGDAGPGQASKHLRVAGKIVAALVERGFVDGSGDNSFDGSRLRHRHGSFDCQSAELARERRVRPGHPTPDGLTHLDSRAFRTNHHNVTALADPWVGERFGDNLRANSAGIAHGHGKAHFHRYILSDT